MEIPRDNTIFEHIRLDGCWEIEESEYLSRGLRRLSSDLSQKVALIDIGANTGLITLQTMNLAETTNDLFLYEPLQNHVKAIKTNLLSFESKCKLQINEFALSDRDGSAQIFIELLNHGNSSLIESAVSMYQMKTQTIQLVNSSNYFSNSFSEYNALVLKSDTQGLDATILSRIPESVWRKIQFAIVEIWALKEINSSEVATLIQLWKHFKYISWDSDGNEIITLESVKEFWLSGSRDSRNLHLGCY